MRHTNAVLFTVVMLASAVAVAQKGDWEAVKNLPPGTRVSVREVHSFTRGTCYILRATDQQLVCTRQLHGRPRILIAVPIPSEVTYERARVREVRLKPGETVGAVNVLIGGAIGAGVGAGIGATANNGTLTRGGSALVLGTAGAVAGAAVSHAFPIIRGKVIYRK